MRAYGFLCINGTEFAFSDRVKDYLHNTNITGLIAGKRFDCESLRAGETFNLPSIDVAPWYDPNVPASADFLGIQPTRIDLLSVPSSSVTQRVNEGAVIGPRTLKHRLLQFTGTMFATSEIGMAYGDRWVNEVLGFDNCGTDTSEALVLPACPGDTRRLLDIGLVDGPTITPLQDGVPECHLSKLVFQLAAGKPFLFGEPEVCMDDFVSSYFVDGVCCMIETDSWPGDAVANVTVTATTDLTNVHLYGKPTFDGFCPHDAGMATWELRIPSIPEGGVLVVDSARKQVFYTDPSLKVKKSGIRMLQFRGPLTYPEIPPCSQFCVCASVVSGEMQVKVDRITREL